MQPAPTVLTLPELREISPPKIGQYFALSSASLPGDLLAVFLSKNGAYITTPFGVLRLDPTNGFIFAGGVVVPQQGIDPIGTVVFPVQNDQRLVGLRLHVQAINLVTAASQCRLTNAVVTTVTR